MNTVGNILTAYYNALNGNVTGFDIYKITVPLSADGNYVQMYPESGGDAGNKSKKAEEVVIRVDIVSVYKNDASQEAVEAADAIIEGIIIPATGDHGLTVASGLQVTNIMRENYSYLIEQDGANTYYRKITRYKNRIIQI